MRRMQMPHRARACGLIERGVQRHFLARPIAGQQFPSALRRDSLAGSRKPSEALVGVTSQPSSHRTLILPEEPGVSPRSNNERPRRQISSRTLLSVMKTACLTLWQRGQAVIPRGKAAGPYGLPMRSSPGRSPRLQSAKSRIAVIGLGSMGFGMATCCGGPPLRSPVATSRPRPLRVLWARAQGREDTGGRRQGCRYCGQRRGQRRADRNHPV